MDKSSQNKSASNNSILNIFIELNVFIGTAIALSIYSLFKFVIKFIGKFIVANNNGNASVEIINITNTREYEPAQFFGKVRGNGWRVTLAVFPDRIDRILKTPCIGSTAIKCSNLTTFTPALARENKVDFNVEGASIFTTNELASF